MPKTSEGVGHKRGTVSAAVLAQRRRCLRALQRSKDPGALVISTPHAATELFFRRVISVGGGNVTLEVVIPVASIRVSSS